MYRVLLRVLAAGILLAATPAGALPIVFFADVNNNGVLDPDEVRTGGVGGNRGSTFTFAFELGTAVSDLASVTIDVSFLTYDHNFLVFVNGGIVLPLDPNNPALFAPAVSEPWTANASGLPRLYADLSATSVSLSGSLTPLATVMTGGLVYNQSPVFPVFIDGLNRITIMNPNGVGTDGIDFTISGNVSPVSAPEPGTALLALLGLVGLAQRSVRRAMG
jgi:MYXO-CTERM domain-containing protein